jgi:hypothetical protein
VVIQMLVAEFPTKHMNILRDFSTKVKEENILKPRIVNYCQILQNFN